MIVRLVRNFFLREFQPMDKRGLNPRSFIQPSETLPVELTGTHSKISKN